jgi:hypothetical protein
MLKAFLKVLCLIVAFAVLYFAGRMHRSSLVTENLNQWDYVITSDDIIQQNPGFFDGIRGNHRMTHFKKSLLLDGYGEATADFFDITNPSLFELVVLPLTVAGIALAVVLPAFRKRKVTGTGQPQDELP